MDPLFLPFVSFTVLCFVLVLWLILIKRQNIKLASQLQGVRHTLAEKERQLDETKHQLREMSDFQQSMAEAQLTTRLQSQRVSLQSQENTVTPEKYQYILTLTEKGMNSDDISSLLSISRHEADQLVNLAQLSQKSSQ